MEKAEIKDQRKNQGWTEKAFETALFQSRFAVLVAVVGSVIAAFIMFLKGCLELVQALTAFVPTMLHFHQTTADDKLVIISIIPAIDYYLFATVVLMFSMGLYELFISELDPPARGDKRPEWLNFKGLDDLKSHIGKVIMMILIINFFEQAFKVTYNGPGDLLYLGAAILLVALSLFTTQNIIWRKPGGEV